MLTRPQQLPGLLMRTVRGSMIPMNLQLFADTGAPGGDGANGGSGGSDSKLELPKTSEDLAKLLQSEADKRVSQALQTAQAKWQADMETKLKTEREEAERLAKLTATEKERALQQKQAEELATRERALAQRELELKTIDLLTEKKLPIEFKPFVLAADEKATTERIDQFHRLFQERLEAAVNERLKGKTPPVNPNNDGTAAPGNEGGFFDAILKNQYRR